ncbi:MAG TPA: carboxypeptidase-like regulatory domain-containing protein [Desulfotignum sp.]|nr:carboxypeptidase-like regulatory domain-containing protein [Desulfotignum sp.]
MKKSILFWITVSLFWCTFAVAMDHETYRPVPESQTSMEGIRFITGGVGIEARQMLDRMADDYTLKVVLATKKGHYLSGCDVRITRADGKKMLSTTTDGPWVLVDLAPGNYQVKAQHDGIWKNRNITVSQNQMRQLVLNW